MRRGIWTPAVILIVAVVSGGWLLQEGVDRSENVYVKVRLLQEVVDRVQSSFVEEVGGERLYNAAIEGLIDDLDDPYSSFLPAREYEDLRISTEGDYGGVGLEVIDRNGFVTVVTPMPGGPGGRAGIRSGDQFWSIGGVRVDTLDSDAAVDMLRGEPGTEVEVEMLRPGVEDPVPFSITREVIRVRAVPFAAMLAGGVGYVPFQSVLETSADEVRAAVDSLRDEGMTHLVLDLRGNLGGLLDQGIAVADLFLEPGQDIAETRGRDPSQNETYRAGRADRYPGLPVAVLVDGSSASASEIVAGALQDHDRALLVGESTFGKGVVQSLYRLSGGNVLRLTTARWYTPLGRSIHKESEERFAEMQEGHPSLALSGQVVTPPDLEGRPTVESEGGRLLYGGGGITPDLIVMPELLTEDEETAVRGLYRQAGRFNVALFNFAVRFVQSHPDLRPGFRLSDDDLTAFYRAMPEWDVRVDRDDFREARRFIEYQLEREIALQAWGDEGQFLQSMRFDRPLGEAVARLRAAPTLERLLEAESPEPATVAAGGDAGS